MLCRVSFILIFLVWKTFVYPHNIEDTFKRLQKTSNSNNQQLIDSSSLETKIKKLQKELFFLYESVAYQAKEKEISASFHKQRKKILKMKKHLRKLWLRYQKALPHDAKERINMRFEEFVTCYGKDEYIYLIPNNIKNIPIQILLPQMDSDIYGMEMLYWLCKQQGIGIQQLTPFLKTFYLEENFQPFSILTDQVSDLEWVEEFSQVCFKLDTLEDFLSRERKFITHMTHLFDCKTFEENNVIYIMGNCLKVKKLLILLFRAMKKDKKEKYKIYTLKKWSSSEAKKTLEIFFKGENLFLQIIEINSSSLLIQAEPLLIKRADKLIKSIEKKIKISREKFLYYYPCKYSSAEEIAETLTQVLFLLSNSSSDHMTDNTQESLPNSVSTQSSLPVTLNATSIERKIKTTSISEGKVVVNTKTNSIVMVVDDETKEVINQLIHQLDVPKKMVRIEVILVEKRATHNHSLGLKKLNFGNQSTHTHETGLGWKLVGLNSKTQNILSFLLNRKSSKHTPATDFLYEMILSQEDLQINASPSVTTINQTPAYIDLVDEISLNIGAEEIDSAGRIILKDSYKRAQYGIQLEIYPTIHEGIGGQSCITLKTKINFDTQKPSSNSRPHVFRRQVINEVCIENGKTVIIGGLKQQDFNESSSHIPYVGELPGIGKFFRNTSNTGVKTEMMIFITPTIVKSAAEKDQEARRSLLKERPGDSLSLFKYMEESNSKLKQELRNKSMNLLLTR